MLRTLSGVARPNARRPRSRRRREGRSQRLGGEPRQRSAVAWSSLRSRSARSATEDHLEAFAGKYAPDALDHLSCVRHLVEHGGRPLLVRAREHSGIAAGGEHQYLHLRVDHPELEYEVDAESVGQANVENATSARSSIPRASASDPACPVTMKSGSRSNCAAIASRILSSSSTTNTRSTRRFDAPARLPGCPVLCDAPKTA